MNTGVALQAQEIGDLVLHVRDQASGDTDAYRKRQRLKCNAAMMQQFCIAGVCEKRAALDLPSDSQLTKALKPA
ncbi:MAG: hypothetical protein FJX25_13500 [Alphaproteobacteria bacterium]|nr:hypothetical protein [Alphaproteobacteria bacterium]